MTERAIEAVLLDAGNTLVFVDPDQLLGIFESCGVPLDSGTFAEAELSARLALTRRLDSASGATGTESHMWREYFGTIFRACGVPEAEMDRVGEEARRIHTEDHLWTHVDPRTPEALRELREAGYRLGVVSNADGRVPALLDRLELGDFFEVVVDSGRVGVEKPDPRIFRIALERLGLDAGTCLYAGDLYPVDVVGARRAGMDAVLIDPWDAFGERDVERVRAVAELPRILGERRERVDGTVA